MDHLPDSAALTLKNFVLSEYASRVSYVLSNTEPKFGQVRVRPTDGANTVGLTYIRVPARDASLNLISP
ncbi:hypothetical protein BDP27DRAFT_1333675 [Rhodocollybia butyracea]|uniref:Uncharacterized protein n=1 Tax=Rhodocollybia butyracea TaxID=206335 RepID=A0A9P5U2V3_9AGAR|nr:hypothetical protein BDP27DRAFT_1333675 [Rhodocollybia butyracea]